jgi:hypothetical protein
METTVCQFNELSDEAKEKARERYRNIMYDDFYFECQMITEDMQEQIKESGFTLNERGLEWNLGHTQGDYIGITGKINDDKINELIMNELTNKEKKRYKLLVIDTYAIEITHKVNYHHYYGQQVEVIVEIGNFDDNEIKESMLDKFVDDTYCKIEKAIKDYVDDVCSDLKSYGYREIEYLYSNEIVDEMLRINEYEFTKDGKRW